MGPSSSWPPPAPCTGPAGTGLTRGVTSSTITMGCVYTSADYAGYEQGLQARIARANKAGGVNGRMINLLPCKDDGPGVQANVQDVQQLVNENNVFGVFSLTEYILPGSTDFLNTNQVPFYGWGFNPGFCGTRWGFGWNGCLGGNSLTQSQVSHAAIAGNLAEAIIKASGLPDSQVRLAVQAENSASGTIGDVQYDTLYKSLGAQVVYLQGQLPGDGGRCRRDALRPGDHGVQAEHRDDLHPVRRCRAHRHRVCGRPGTRGQLRLHQLHPRPSPVLGQLAAALSGEYVNTQVVPQEENTPWIMQEDADLTAIGQKPFVTLGGAIGYAEAEEFIEQAQAVGATLNTKTFDQTVNDGSFVSYTGITGGLGELDWPAAHLLPADCAAIVKIVGTTYQVAEPFACYSSLKVF